MKRTIPLQTSLLIAMLAIAVACRTPSATAPDSLAATPASTVASVDEQSTIHYRSATVEGVEIFYREAGPRGAPVLLLLHGFPTSSHMFRNIIPALATRYRVIAPDYPGFGQSAVPNRASFSYTFAHFAELIDGLVTQLELERYALYIQDYGAPVGLRLALRHPERVTALIAQNGNAYEDGFSDFWKPLQAYWADGSDAHRQAMRVGLTLDATRSQYLDGVSDTTRIDPDNWVHDQALLERPGIDEVMLDLWYDYRTNIALYPQFQAFFRKYQPPTLLVWGANDVIFPAAGARAYLRDLPGAELHLLESGHFALEDKGAEITNYMLDFLARKLPPT